MLDKIITLGERILDAAARVKALNLSRDAILRSLYFEITTNLSTLDLIHADKLKPENLAALASALEIETCAAVLFADNEANAEVKEFLDKKGKVLESGENDEKPAVKHRKSVLRALLFIVRRVIALQKIAALGSAADGVLINVRLAARLDNIKRHLVLVKKKLKEFDKEKHFLFA